MDCTLFEPTKTGKTYSCPDGCELLTSKEGKKTVRTCVDENDENDNVEGPVAPPTDAPTVPSLQNIGEDCSVCAGGGSYHGGQCDYCGREGQCCGLYDEDT